MKCPNCDREIVFVLVINECTQEALVALDGKTLYYEPDTINNTICIVCPNCDSDISEVIG